MLEHTPYHVISRVVTFYLAISDGMNYEEVRDMVDQFDIRYDPIKKHVHVYHDGANIPDFLDLSGEYVKNYYYVVRQGMAIEQARLCIPVSDTEDGLHNGYTMIDVAY